MTCAKVTCGHAQDEHHQNAWECLTPGCDCRAYVVHVPAAQQPLFRVAS